MKKRFLAALATGLLVVGLGGVSQALTIDPSNFTLNDLNDALILYGNQTSQAAIDAIINPYLNGDSIELYKADVPDEDAVPPVVLESGALFGSYDTVFSNTPFDPEDATITYTGGDIVGPTAYALVKDGNQSPSWYFFNLTALGWNGTDTLEFQNFWPTQGAISHVTLYGNSAPVPEPATMLLFGTGLAGLAGIARRRNKTNA